MHIYSKKIHAIFLAIIVSIIIIAYYQVFLWWYDRCTGIDSYYSHAFLIPFISGFLIWKKRLILLAKKPEICIWGLSIIIFACLMHIAGTILYVFSISGFSFFFLIIGMMLYLFGKEITFLMTFPLAYLLFMFPLPLAALNAISFPLKMIVAELGTKLVQIVGIPIYREGFNISLPLGNLVVGNPCSGLRSLISFLAIGSIFAYLLPVSMFKKLFMFIISIPIAIASNILRVPILIIIAYKKGIIYASPESIWHDASGALVFIVGLLLFYLIGNLILRKSSIKYH